MIIIMQTKTIRTKLLFILIGNDKTGKTNLQKSLIKRITGEDKDARLDINLEFDIVHPEIKRKYQKIFFGNRSFQEKKAENTKGYENVSSYFKDHFKDCDIAFISSHLVTSDIKEMIEEGHKRFFNVNAIFFSNSIEEEKEKNGEISLLNWDERFVIQNPKIPSSSDVKPQLEEIAESVVELLINRTKIS